MRFLGVFSTRGNDRWDRTAHVIARTNRGLEVGEILCEATDAAVQQLQETNYGQILRGMTAEDANELNHIQSREPEEFNSRRSSSAQLGLQMELVDVEHLFGGERIVVYYLAERPSRFPRTGEGYWRASSRRGSKCARSECATRPSCWPTTAIAASRSAATRTSRDAAGVDEDGQAAEGDARPDEDLRPLRAAEVLPALRVRHVR